jgi:glycosyltransferase involved in cell wall biosynthesis
MPVYNGEAYLRAAIESILSQTFSDFEFIIVDDGSHDQSRKIVENYHTVDGRIRLILKDTRMGISSALNQAIKTARAPVLARFDCDDVALPHRLQTQYDWLARDTDISVIGSWAFLIDADGQRNWRIKRQPVGKERVRRLLPLHNCLLHPAAMFHKTAFLKAGMYDERFFWGQDYDLWLRMLPHGSLDNIPEPLLELRRHSGQVSEPSKRRSSTLYSVASAINFFCRKYGEPELSAISSADAAEFVYKFEALFSHPLVPADNAHLVRHLIRLRRYSFFEGPVADHLSASIGPNSSYYARAKIKFYDLLKRTNVVFR